MRLRAFSTAYRWLIVVSICAASSPLQAQEWPRQPVHLIVPYAPGGAVDMLGRALAERLSQRWKQPVVVDNRAGGAEVIAAQYVAAAKPDGYTLLLATEIGLETNQFLFSRLPYDPVNDFTPITRLIEGALVYVVKADSPIRSMQELVATAKAHPNKISYGSSGTGGAIHIATEWLATVAGNVQFVHAPYKGSAPTMADTLAGVIDFTAAPMSVVAPYVADKRMRALAVSGATRMSTLPDTPSFAELGYRDAVSTFMFGLAGPARMPSDLVQRIADDAAAVMRDPQMKKQSLDPYGFAVSVESPASFQAFLVADREYQRTRVKAANVKLD